MSMRAREDHAGFLIPRYVVILIDDTARDVIGALAGDRHRVTSCTADDAGTEALHKVAGNRIDANIRATEFQIHHHGRTDYRIFRAMRVGTPRTVA